MVVFGIDCLACTDKFFMNNHLDVKENDEHALDFILHLYHICRSRWVWTLPLGGLLLCLRVIAINPFVVASDNASHFSQDLGKIRCTLAVLLPNPLGKCTIPDTWLHRKDVNYQHVCPAAWNFVHWLPRYDSILICCYIMLQLLYRWQHQSQNIWIPHLRITHVALLYSPHLLAYSHLNFSASEPIQLVSRPCKASHDTVFMMLVDCFSVACNSYTLWHVSN
jgi:hypothetical protein